mgnify:CR=1 FL=1
MRNMPPTYRILPVIENRSLGPYTYLRIEDPEMLLVARCGHFLMVGFSSSIDPFLPRPLSLFEVEENSFSILVKVRGRGSDLLSKTREGENLKILGPLGTPFNPPESGVLIAGGIGIAPLYYQSGWMKSGKLFYGTKKKEELILTREMEERDFTVKTITQENGGTVCDLVRMNKNDIEGEKIFICGPWDMIRALKEILGEFATNAFVYLERRMGCGLGGCKSCAVKTNSGYKLVCQEGPLFPLSEVRFD